MNKIFYIVLFVGFSSLCVYRDIKTKKIPNWLNAAAIITILFYWNFFMEPIEFSILFRWWVIAFALWIFKVIGAGDAKMLFWLGIGIPESEQISGLVGMIGIGGIYVLTNLILSKRLKLAILNIRNAILRRPFIPNKVIFSPALVLAMALSHFWGFEKIFKF